MKPAKTYSFHRGRVVVVPRIAPVGAFEAMGETHVAEARVFDVFMDGKLIATAETWEQACDMAAFAQLKP